MKVLKFGGTSVAHSQNILLVEEIIKRESLKSKVVVIVSALHGVTDQLIKAAEYASVKDENYIQTVQNLEEKHINLVKELFPIAEQSAWLSFVKKHFNDIEDLCNGIAVLGELTNRIKDKIASYGEFLSSNIMAARLQQEKLDCLWMNSAELIRTDSNFTHAKVDFDTTEKNIIRFLNDNQNQIIIGPGFIARDEKNNTTTLGRGGSDYTASVFSGGGR